MVTERISEILDLKGITKYRFCKDLGLSNGFLDKPREITTDKYANILEYLPDVSPEWLLTGKGPMFKNKDSLVTSEDQVQYNWQSNEVQYLKKQVTEQKKELDNKQKIIENQQKIIDSQLNIIDAYRSGKIKNASDDTIPKKGVG